MGQKRISGMGFDINIMDMMVHVEKATLSLTDNTAAVQTRGVPDGFIDGDVSAELELELDSKNFNLLSEQAKSAGSWRGIETFDALFYAKAGDDEIKIETFGNKLTISDLLDVDPKGSSKQTHKIKCPVTSPDFIHINGVPYLSADDTRHLLG
jgi:hypothetical protein